MLTHPVIRPIFFVFHCFLFITAGFISHPCFAQETNTHVNGLVKSVHNEILINATVTAVHEPTNNTYYAQTNSKGYFYFFNIKPGGPYTITISYTGFEPLSKTNLFLRYSAQNFYSSDQENQLSEFILKEKSNRLEEVSINARMPAQKYGVESNIDNSRISMMPSISRNLQDYLRLIPNAKVNSDGGISLAGQNNKYNAFFIDGSNTNDLLGLAISGTAGGQTNSPPISMEAIEEIKVSQSPYDVEYSNFTGGSINAITKSGSNQSKSSAWYFFRNEKMAGRSPIPVEKPGTQNEFIRPRLNPFFNQTAGVYTSGAFVKNKLFYFLLTEYQTEMQPQPYNFLEYKGNSKQQDLMRLADTVRKRYGYEPGSFLESANELNAKRFIAKLDWNPGSKNKLTLSYRYNGAERTTPQQQNGNSLIRFSNNRYRLPSTINSASLEWKRYSSKAINNRLLLTYNNELTERKIMGHPFPQVTINDGMNVNVIFGSTPSSNASRFIASEFSLLDILRFIRNKHSFSTGIDLDITGIRDLALSSYFGWYRFSSIKDFIANAYPTRYTRNTSLSGDQTNAVEEATARYNAIRAGAFVNDEIQVNENLELSAGVRIDANALPLRFREDQYFNTIARTEIEKYYDLEGAISGKAMKTDWKLSPRVGFTVKIPGERITIRGGAGIFSGHILNVWASQVYAVNIASLNLSAPTPPQYYGLHFNPDPYSQPDFQSLAINPDSVKGTLQLVSKNFKYPTVFRSSLGIDKNFNHNWNLATEFLFTKNMYENRYTDVNILPASKTSSFPDSRAIYSTGALTNKMSLPGGNPYSHIILLSNNRDKKGFSYSFMASASKSIKSSLYLNLAYSFSRSFALFDPVGNANTSDGQWLQLETVNGKNLASRSVSDFDLGHRISAVISKKVIYGKWSSMVSLVYNGQSGSPFSYVYDSSMINDDGRLPGSNSDLIYIPTQDEVNEMVFIPSNIPGKAYTPQQQKDLLNDYIEHDRYLRKHRGQFAERNGARMPFTHVIDLRFQQDVKLKLKRKETTISVIYDVFNFTNVLNRNWGRSFFISGNDNYALITFAGFTDENTLTPQYKFIPNGKPWSVQNSTAPGSSARWISQLGVKITF